MERAHVRAGGFTLIEILVTALIVVLISAAVANALKTFTVPGYYLSYFGSLGSRKMSASSVVLGSGAPVTSIATARSHLFPFTSFVGSTYNYTGNYQVWAGKCASEQPLVPPAGIDTATVTPGSAVPATVGEPALDRRSPATAPRST